MGNKNLTLLCGFGAAGMFTVFALLMKIVVAKLHPAWIGWLVSAGSLLAFSVYIAIENYRGTRVIAKEEGLAVFLSILMGIVWMLAIVINLNGLNWGLDISRLACLNSTSALITAIAAIFLMGEVKDSGDIWRVLTGAGLVFLGSILIIPRA